MPALLRYVQAGTGIYNLEKEKVYNMFKLIRKIIVLALLALLLANLSSRAEAGLIWMAAKKMSHMNQ
jgi:ABC-type nitrate/sulfonate/bicarbonate transport system permease component